ncbi:MAG TPA: TMEM175 family protein [Candidatus Bathyarchaeia archaeon]|nr:TMEM175 family protein [Candidatus Bathyarchaeia archaeon]
MSGERIRESSESPRIKIRIESLSDLVFGLALSIGSLELLARTPQTPTDLAASVALFAFSFLIVVSIWFGYARIMAVIPQETGAAISLNLLLLFCVVLEPYLFFVLQSQPSNISFLDWASFGYALDVGAMFLILGGLIRPILRKKISGVERPELHPVLLRRFRIAMFFYAFVAVTYFVSALPFFWVDTPIGPLRFVLWYSAFAFVFLGLLNRRRERT